MVVEARRRADQALRIGMRRPLEDILGAAGLDDLPGIHHRDAVAEAGDDAEIVGDQQHRKAERFLEAGEQLQHLRLDRHVERRGRLVGDQQFRLAGDRHGDHHALAHAARQFMRILPGTPRRRRDARPPRAGRGRGGRRRPAIRPRWRRSTSEICSPTLISGLSDVIGSWKTSAISRPRISRAMRAPARVSSDWPFQRISPPEIRPGHIDQPHHRLGGDALARPRTRRRWPASRRGRS